MLTRITGTGSALPKLRVTNDDLSKIMDTSDQWIRSRTGIESRYLATEETTTGMSVEAAQKALDASGVKPEELELIIAATLSGDTIIPSLACMVQAELGARKAVAFDVGAACSGFLFAMSIANAYLSGGMYKNALIIGAETLSKMMDWEDRGTCVLFGDGAGAAVLVADENKNQNTEQSMAGEKGILSMAQGSDGSRGGALICSNRPVNNPYKKQISDYEYVHMDGQAVYKFAVRTVPEVIHHALEQADVSAEQIDFFLLHQANKRIIESVAKRLKQPIEKFPMNMQDYGNISAASVPILLDNACRCGIKSGDKIVLAGFGAGVTWGAAVITW